MFKGWSHGPSDECVILSEPGPYAAQYTNEVLLQVRSQVRTYRVSTWVPKGEPVRLSVLERVEEEPGVRFLFEEWTVGEARFSPENTIFPNRPITVEVKWTTVEVKWTKEYFLKLEGPEEVDLVGSGWYGERQSVVLKAPATAFRSGENERLQFKEWDVVSNPALVIPNKGQPITSIRMDATHTIRAAYEIGYRVVVKNPLGTIKSAWVSEGDELVIETPPQIDIAAERERYIFAAWDGSDAAEPTGFVVVSGPKVISALYDREFRVTVIAPYGVSGDGWYREGEVATISAPENPSSLLFLKKVFNGFSGYLGQGSNIQVEMTGPLTISASYRTEIEWALVAIVGGALVAIGLIYLVTQREYVRRKAAREAQVQGQGQMFTSTRPRP